MLVVALAGVHAFYPRDIRNLLIDGIDLANRRLRHSEIDRPLDDFTRAAAVSYLNYRNRRWPHTANPHLLLSQQSAKNLNPVSADPLHLAAVFGIDPQTSIRYTAAQRSAAEPPTDKPASPHHQ